jgi:hypothetical protein
VWRNTRTDSQAEVLSTSSESKIEQKKALYADTKSSTGPHLDGVSTYLVTRRSKPQLLALRRLPGLGTFQITLGWDVLANQTLLEPRYGGVELTSTFTLIYIFELIQRSSSRNCCHHPSAATPEGYTYRINGVPAFGSWLGHLPAVCSLR